MNIYINNDTDYNLDGYAESVRAACEAALESGGGISASVGVTFVTDEVIREMNSKYRAADYVTDVLSFPADKGPDGTLFGDIFICFDQALRQAKTIGNTGRRELAFLAVHGALHLLGYDHNDAESESIMINKQKEIMKKLP